MNKQPHPFIAKEESPIDLSRRGLLKAGVAGLVVAATMAPRALKAATASPGAFATNAFVHVAPDNSVTVAIKHLEMGQGVSTGLTTIVAEELDADWAQMRFAFAPADVKKYKNFAFGMQGTGGSTAVSNSYDQLRKAGATARAMLVEAAAQDWNAPAEEITVAKGVVSHAASDKSATFGELAEKAATLTPPESVVLKDPKDFTLIGKELPRKDNKDKTTGKGIFALDVTRPGMVYAAIAHPPRFGGKVKSYSHRVASGMKGVKSIVTISSGLAVVADSYWTALKARDSLEITWDETNAEKRGTAELLAEYKALSKSPGLSARKEGNADKALNEAEKIVSAEFEFPFLAHAPMEPLDCVVEVREGEAEIWAGCQFQTLDQLAAAKILGLEPFQVKINTVYAGGSFGRRATPNSDYISEATEIAKTLPKGMPVKLIWSREDDVKGGRYRPMYYHAMKAGLDGGGNLSGWSHTIVGQSAVAGSAFGGAPGVVDPTSVEGASNLPYAVPNIAVDLHTTEVGVPVLWWRSVGSTHNAYATEVFIDMAATAAGKDPVEFRMDLLGSHDRHKAVLKLAAEKANWGTPLPEGRARGVAVAESFGSFVAQIAEVSQNSDGGIKVERVVCAVDCGVAINPDVIRAQMEGGIGYGLSAILKGAITLKDGVVEQDNFDSYQVLRMNEMPKVEVHIVPSTASPSGVGEPGVPPAGPAVANAVFALTGRRVTKLPMMTGLSS
jgi:isoquinoline 1-oxidoreductase beta subunit